MRVRNNDRQAKLKQLLTIISVASLGIFISVRDIRRRQAGLVRRSPAEVVASILKPTPFIGKLLNRFMLKHKLLGMASLILTCVLLFKYQQYLGRTARKLLRGYNPNPTDALTNYPEGDDDSEINGTAADDDDRGNQSNSLDSEKQNGNVGPFDRFRSSSDFTDDKFAAIQHVGGISAEKEASEPFHIKSLAVQNQDLRRLLPKIVKKGKSQGSSDLTDMMNDTAMNEFSEAFGKYAKSMSSARLPEQIEMMDGGRNFRLGYGRTNEDLGLSIDDQAVSSGTINGSLQGNMPLSPLEEEKLGNEFDSSTREISQNTSFLPELTPGRLYELLRFLQTMKHTIQGIDTVSIIDLYYSMERIYVPRGRVLFHAGDDSDSGMYIVVKGRLGAFAVSADINRGLLQDMIENRSSSNNLQAAGESRYGPFYGQFGLIHGGHGIMPSASSSEFSATSLLSSGATSSLPQNFQGSSAENSTFSELRANEIPPEYSGSLQHDGIAVSPGGLNWRIYWDPEMQCYMKEKRIPQTGIRPSVVPGMQLNSASPSVSHSYDPTHAASFPNKAQNDRENSAGVTRKVVLPPGPLLCSFPAGQTVGENGLLASTYSRSNADLIGPISLSAEDFGVDATPSHISVHSAPSGYPPNGNSNVGNAQTVGSMDRAVSVDETRPVTLAAVEDSWVLRMDRSLFTMFAAEHPCAIVSFILTTTARQWRVAYFCLVEFFQIPEAWRASLGPPGFAPTISLLDEGGVPVSQTQPFSSANGSSQPSADSYPVSSGPKQGPPKIGSSSMRYTNSASLVFNANSPMAAFAAPPVRRADARRRSRPTDIHHTQSFQSLPSAGLHRNSWADMRRAAVDSTEASDAPSGSLKTSENSANEETNKPNGDCPILHEDAEAPSPRKPGDVSTSAGRSSQPPVSSINLGGTSFPHTPAPSAPNSARSADGAHSAASASKQKPPTDFMYTYPPPVPMSAASLRTAADAVLLKQPGELIYEEGSEARALFVILSGTARTEMRKGFDALQASAGINDSSRQSSDASTVSGNGYGSDANWSGHSASKSAIPGVFKTGGGLGNASHSHASSFPGTSFHHNKESTPKADGGNKRKNRLRNAVFSQFQNQPHAQQAAQEGGARHGSRRYRDSQILGPGCIAGGIACFANVPHRESLIAVEAVQVAVFSRSSFVAVAESPHQPQSTPGTTLQMPHTPTQASRGLEAGSIGRLSRLSQLNRAQASPLGVVPHPTPMPGSPFPSMSPLAGALGPMAALAVGSPSAPGAHSKLTDRSTTLMEIALGVARAFVPLLRLFLELGLQRVWLRSGEILERRGDPFSGMSVIISGRIRTVVDDSRVSAVVAGVNSGQKAQVSSILNAGTRPQSKKYCDPSFGSNTTFIKPNSAAAKGHNQVRRDCSMIISQYSESPTHPPYSKSKNKINRSPDSLSSLASKQFDANGRTLIESSSGLFTEKGEMEASVSDSESYSNGLNEDEDFEDLNDIEENSDEDEEEEDNDTVSLSSSSTIGDGSRPHRVSVMDIMDPDFSTDYRGSLLMASNGAVLPMVVDVDKDPSTARRIFHAADELSLVREQSLVDADGSPELLSTTSANIATIPAIVSDSGSDSLPPSAPLDGGLKSSYNSAAPAKNNSSTRISIPVDFRREKPISKEKMKAKNREKEKEKEKVHVSENSVRIDSSRGQTVGELAILAHESHCNSTSWCVRDCEIVKVSPAAFKILTAQYPSVMTKLARILASRLSSARSHKLSHSVTGSALSPGVGAAMFGRSTADQTLLLKRLYDNILADEARLRSLHNENRSEDLAMLGLQVSSIPSNENNGENTINNNTNINNNTSKGFLNFLGLFPNNNSTSSSTINTTNSATNSSTQRSTLDKTNSIVSLSPSVDSTSLKNPNPNVISPMPGLSASVLYDLPGTHAHRFITISVVPAGDCPAFLSDFTLKLIRALERTGDGPVLHMSLARLEAEFGAGSHMRLGEMFVRARVGAWLSAQEERYRFIVFEADMPLEDDTEGQGSSMYGHSAGGAGLHAHDHSYLGGPGYKEGSLSAAYSALKLATSRMNHSVGKLGRQMSREAPAILGRLFKGRSTSASASGSSAPGGRGSGVAPKLTSTGSSSSKPLEDLSLDVDADLKQEMERHKEHQRLERRMAWTKLCVRQSDLCLLVGQAHSAPNLSEAERHCVYKTKKVQSTVSNSNLMGLFSSDSELEGDAVVATGARVPCRKELVLLHFDPGLRPRGTRNWLRRRKLAWHHHVRTFQPADYARLARHICGKSRGLVLGGGGARGLAHLGVLQELQERGVDVDVVGGTSQGAFMAAAFALTLDSNGCAPIATRLASQMGSSWRLLTSLTLPVFSYFSGHSLNEILMDAFGPTQIEDLWVRYFCVTTNVTDASMGVHTTGPLWRYVRASMTVMGLLPPLMDNHTGDLLVDGGYVNNLPLDVLRRLAPQTGMTVCVDVENKDNSMFEGVDDPGDSISGWYILWKWIISGLRLGPPLKVPSLSEITLKVSYIAHSMQIRELMARADEELLYMRPDVGTKFKLLDYDKMNEIVLAGRKCANEVLSIWELRQKKRIYRELQHRLKKK